MATTANDKSTIAANLDAARSVIEEHGTPQRIARLSTRYPSGATGALSPGSLGHDAYRSELVAGLAEIVDDLATP